MGEDFKIGDVVGLRCDPLFRACVIDVGVKGAEIVYTNHSGEVRGSIVPFAALVKRDEKAVP